MKDRETDREIEHNRRGDLIALIVAGSIGVMVVTVMIATALNAIGSHP